MDIYKKRKPLNKKLRTPPNQTITERMVEFNKRLRKLTPEQAKAVRDLYYTSSMSCREIGKTLGCKANVIYNIIKYKTYLECGGRCNYECNRDLGNNWDCVVAHDH